MTMKTSHYARLEFAYLPQSFYNVMIPFYPRPPTWKSPVPQFPFGYARQCFGTYLPRVWLKVVVEYRLGLTVPLCPTVG